MNQEADRVEMPEAAHKVRTVAAQAPPFAAWTTQDPASPFRMLKPVALQRAERIPLEPALQPIA